MTIFNPMMWKNDEGLYFNVPGLINASNCIRYQATSSKAMAIGSKNLTYITETDLVTIDGVDINTSLYVLDTSDSVVYSNRGIYTIYGIDGATISSNYISTNINGRVGTHGVVMIKSPSSTSETYFRLTNLSLYFDCNNGNISFVGGLALGNMAMANPSTSEIYIYINELVSVDPLP